jgi:osmotically inducible protein OsmC
MVVSTANAEWRGNIKDGKGDFRVGESNLDGSFTAESRLQVGHETIPESLIAAAHAGCFSMAFSFELSQAGFTPQSIETEAKVSLNYQKDHYLITKIELDTVAMLADGEEISTEKFNELAEITKNTCPVSRALAAVPRIELKARLATAA